jgi:hypothetical protein
MPVTTPAVRLARLRRQLAINAATVALVVPNRGYNSEIKKFCKWVERQRVSGDLPRGRHLVTRKILDLYFTMTVPYRNGVESTVAMIHRALSWYVKHRPVDCDPPNIVVVNDIVTKAYQAQKARHEASTKKAADPHYGLKDTMTDTDKKKIVSFVLNERESWGPELVVNNMGHQVGTRGASMRAFVYCDMNLTRGFGPEKEGRLSRTLTMVLRKGSLHKDHHITDKQVGWWRHREYMLCTSFALSMHVLWDLVNDPTINFFHRNKKERNDWWGKKFIPYEEYDDQAGPMDVAYAATGVSSCKKTHLRTLAVQHAGSEGLAPWQINTMTKHMLEKINSAYQSEVDKKTMKVMAGFSQDESYFVPRASISLPLEIDQLCHLMIPKLAEWRMQAESPRGDKSICCRKFLWEILPLFVEILVQDGIYLIRDFPNHEMSHYLKVRRIPVPSFNFVQSPNFFIYCTLLVLRIKL